MNTANARRRWRSSVWMTVLLPGIVMNLMLLCSGKTQDQSTAGHDQPSTNRAHAAMTNMESTSHPAPASKPMMNMKSDSSASHKMSGQTPEQSVPDRAPVMLNSAQRQLINVRTQAVTNGPAVVGIRTVGIVTYDETRLVNINTKIMGWAEKLYVDKSGQFVESGRPLIDIYSPELYSAQYEYMLAYRHCERLKHNVAQLASTNIDSALKESVTEALTLQASARKRLELWDITKEEIKALETSGQPSDTLQLDSPVTGHVIDKQIDPGQMVRPGLTMYRIADLNTVWINADLYEFELPLIKEGQKAQVTAVAYPGEQFEARVDFIYPYSENRTRTTTARLVLDNPHGRLKPDMYVNVSIDVDLGEKLLVPKGAVFDTGTRQYVFVETKEGMFVPRRIEVGPRVGDQYAILTGLAAGEKVVMDGNFLIDSESQLKTSGSGGGHQH